MSDSLQVNEDDIQLFLRIKIKLIFIPYRTLLDALGGPGLMRRTVSCFLSSENGELTQYKNCVRQESIPLKSA